MNVKYQTITSSLLYIQGSFKETGNGTLTSCIENSATHESRFLFLIEHHQAVQQFNTCSLATTLSSARLLSFRLSYLIFFLPYEEGNNSKTIEVTRKETAFNSNCDVFINNHITVAIKAIKLISDSKAIPDLLELYFLIINYSLRVNFPRNNRVTHCLLIKRF